MRSIWKVALIVIGVLLISWGCLGPGEKTPVPPPLLDPDPATLLPTAIPAVPCGDGICDEVETNSGNCPQDCESSLDIESQMIGEFEYFVENPVTGSNIYLRIFPSASSQAQIPTLILIPGGIGDSTIFTDEAPGGSAIEKLGRDHFHLVVFDPEGRGRSEGEENYNGFIGQDALHIVTRFVSELPTVGKIGFFSQSYGVSLAAGVLARYPESPVAFLIDWEGPANREDITLGCRSTNQEDTSQSTPQDRSCEEELYWQEREAETFAAEIQVPYLRLQSLDDHAQPDLSHAEDMIRAATRTIYGGYGQSPWTRLNGLDPNTIYDPLDESLLEEIDRNKYELARAYARELFTMNIFASAGDPGDQDALTGAKLYLGLMVHLEGWMDEMDQEEKYLKHMESAMDLAEIFEDHNAAVTFEASPETIEASATWDNLLLALQERGHGIGVHADRGTSQNPNYTLAIFTSELRRMKQDAEALGLIIEHVSGICSDQDWAKAAIDAGYGFTTGGVGYCAMSMPEEMRPDIYLDCPSPMLCHGNMPLEMAGRIHPWRIDTAAADWTRHDPGGRLVNLASDSGIKNLYEETLDSQSTHGDMEYTIEDIDVLVMKVEEALALAQPGQINQIYFSLSIGAADVDARFYESMFTALQPYVDAGVLEYKSLNEIYHLYLGSN